ncbi:Multidrug resistance protein MdtN [Roseovarius sp. THAF8]|uniref:efflux RND transporter periplasmic adaptor subunit n=1 Tax=Roseovarius sp. THAF8 TaxID=2587846 RepID=UPI001268577A|nr:efflux RND transporter periplasmic adaptor subunit [Roseovarius sp. THAF8]QFT96360.1 Multidrug resistance protein MdtN [Roseovarius sp. THAF8]
MRLFPIFAAILVCAAIYALVMERDSIAALFAPVEDTELAEAVAPDTDQGDDPLAETPEEREGTVGVVALRSTARTIDTAVTVRGQTEADRQVELRAETPGQIVSEPIRKGAFVEEDQTLCQIDPGTREANLAEALARLAEARSRIPEAEAAVPEAAARVEESRARLVEARAVLSEAEINANAADKLSTDGFASQTRVAQTKAAVEGAKAQITSAEAALKAAESGQETAAAGIEAARSGVESAQAAVASARKEIERLTIKAPFSGLLESDTAELGSLLQAGSLCATVIQLDPIMLVGYIPETEIAKVSAGAPATARLASGGTVEGEVTFISRAADPTTRTFRVDIRVPNEDLALRDGQTAEIRIESEGVKAHLLPQSALTLDDDGALGVRIVSPDKTAQFKPVTLLRDSPTGVFVAGLEETSDVIILGQEFVADGVPVEPAFRETIQ